MASLDDRLPQGTNLQLGPSAQKKKNAKKRRAAKRKKDVIKMLKDLTVEDKESIDADANESTTAAKNKSKSEKRRNKRRQLREMKKIYSSSTGVSGSVIDEALLMKAIEDELDYEESLDNKTETSQDGPLSDSVLLAASSMKDDDEEEEDSDDDDINEDHMMEILRGSLATLAAGDFEDDDEDDEEGQEEYIPAMPRELVGAFRRYSVTTPQYMPSSPTISEGHATIQEKEE